ncbi:MAG: cation:proton antiporter [Actinomycetota bacterium]|nr:cation:proton antiporter [Actinomycetota bacterium]
MDRATFSTLAVIAVVAVVAPVISELLRGRLPGVVLEVGLGIVIGPQVLAVAEITPVIDALAGIGLTFLFFMAGYEIDLQRIRGRPLRLAALGWCAGLVLALTMAATLVITGLALSTLLIGLALTTTALGTLLPMLADNGEMHTRFGALVLAIGGAGEFLPVVAITLLLSGHNPLGTGLLLVAFVVLAAGAAALALRPTPPRIAQLLRRTLDTSSQLPIRIAVLIVALFVFLASRLGLDVLLGAFAAGLLVGLANQGETASTIETKLSGLAFGLFVPLFFIVSGMQFDVDALTKGFGTLVRVPLFLAMFFVVRGLPTLWSHRHDLGPADRVAAALLASTALPVVVAITKIGLERHDMRSENAAALVAAGMLSVVLFPTTAFAIRRRSVRRSGGVARTDDSP